jgi:Uri superfamily endonuclease
MIILVVPTTYGPRGRRVKRGGGSGKMRARERQAGGLPDGGGVYALVLRLAREHRLQVGALGEVLFPAGLYCYVGSARRGLRARLRRHLRTGGKRRHWHVDYLRDAAEPRGVLLWTGADADECRLSDRIASLARWSVPGFGCSDCRCDSHLHRVERDALASLRVAMGNDMAWQEVGRRQARS